MRLRLAIAAALGAIALWAVPASAISLKTAGARYVSLAGSINATLTSFEQTAGKWTNSTTNAQAESDAQPVIRALQRARNTLQRDKWPTNARGDVKTLARSIGPLITDLRGLAKLDLNSANKWANTFESDARAVATAASAVRSDLNLSAG